MRKLFTRSSGIALSAAVVAGLMLSGCDKEEEMTALPADAGVITQAVQEDGSVLLSVDEIAGAETYNWYKDGGSVQNTDSRTYLAVESGLYKVAGVNAAGEGKVSEEISVEVSVRPDVFNILTEEYVPDDAFREYIRTEIAGKDEYTNVEAASYNGEIVLNGSGISDLTGIGYFTSLSGLRFTGDTELETLDLCANKTLKVVELTDCENLSELYIDGLGNIETLLLSGTSLGAFDISKYEDALAGTLRNLDLSNLGVYEIDLKPFTHLERVGLNYSSLASLDMSGLTSLKSLSCSNIWLLESLDVTGCIALDTLVASFCELTSLDLSTNSSLSCLAIQENPLGNNVEVSHLKNLEFLNISYIGRTEMIDFSGFTKLMDMECQNNDFSGAVLDLSDSPLTRLRCENNGLVGLDISSSVDMYELYCYSNELERLDISMCTGLEYLFCEDNPMTEIKVWPDFDMDNPPVWMKDEKADYVYEFGQDPDTDPDDPDVDVPEVYQPWIGTWKLTTAQTMVWVQDPDDPRNEIPEFQDIPMELTIEIEWSEDRYMLAFNGWCPGTEETVGMPCPAFAMQNQTGGVDLWSGMALGDWNGNSLMWCGAGLLDSGEVMLVSGQYPAYTMTLDGDVVTFTPYEGQVNGLDYTVNGFDLFQVDPEYGYSYPISERSPAGEMTMTRIK